MTQACTNLSLEKVAQRLDGAKITWAVFAGAAAAAYGVTRPLTDTDILVPVALATQTAALFPQAQVKRREDGSVEWIKLPGFDIMPGLTNLNLDAEMAARLTQHRLSGVTVPIIPPEDNILLKALLGRGPEVGKHDWEDVEGMMAHLPSLDWDYLRWRADTSIPRERRGHVMERLEALWHRIHQATP